jgi:WD40 repeat protein
MMINEHQGEIVHSKWNPNKKLLATGGNGDCFVDLWDLTTNSSKPMKQLRHISGINANETTMPARSDENHYISSMQWSNNGDRLLTSAYDNIARVWNLDGKLQGLFSAQNSLIFSCWNKSDTLVASGGDETNVLVWNPNTI